MNLSGPNLRQEQGAPLRPKLAVDHGEVSTLGGLSLRHLLRDVAVEQSAERNAGRAGIFGFLVQLNDEALQMLPESFFGLVDRRIERLNLRFPLRPFHDVVAKLPGESLCPFHFSYRAVLIPIDRFLEHCGPPAILIFYLSGVKAPRDIA